MDVKKAGAVLLIPVDRIRTNPNQPRKHFDSAELASLGESIRRNGILQPLSVRAQDADGSYELIAGERRLRAAAESGFDRVPCIVINADSAQAAVYSVIENLQRRDLNFFEEALAIESPAKNSGSTGRRYPRSSEKLRPPCQTSCAFCACRRRCARR